MLKSAHLDKWQPPEEWHRIVTVDAHAGGEPLRVIVNGYPQPPGSSMLEKRAFLKANFDALRTSIMWEPRGHADMYGCLVTPPISETSDFGVLFMHNAGYSTMCGHGIIAVTRVLLDLGVFTDRDLGQPFVIETPAGIVRSRIVQADDGREKIGFVNVASFVEALDQKVEVPGLGTVPYDLAFGGAYYAFVNLEEIGLAGSPEETEQLVRHGRAIKSAVQATSSIVHPADEELGFLYGTIFFRNFEHNGVHSRHICVFADGEVDRSPTGTGVSARAAILHARRELAPGTPITIESLIGSTFSVRILDTGRLGSFVTVIPEVSGTAFITGRHEFYLNTNDPLNDGFFIR